jgi:hypothetical protein
MSSMNLLLLAACFTKEGPATDVPSDTGGADTSGEGDTFGGDSGSVDTDTGGPDTGDADTDTGDTDTGGPPVDTGGPVDLSTTAGAWWEGESSDLALTGGRFVGDLDGDGTDDVALLTTRALAPDRVEAIWYVPGGQAVGPAMTAVGTASAEWEAGYPSWPRFVKPAGDMDGDGWPDLWLGRGGELSQAALVLGPPSRWSTGTLADDADIVLGAGDQDAVTNLDFDGDGRVDVASFMSDDATGAGGGVYLLHGETARADLDVDLAVRCDGPYHFTAGDLTGDGVPDLVMSFSEGTRLLDGADLPGDGDIQGEDLFGTTIDANVAARVAVIGDWTGDGVDDWAMTGGTGERDYAWEGVVHVFAGGTTAAAAGEMDADVAAAGSFLGGYESADFGAFGVTPLPARDGGGGFDLVTSITASARSDALAVVIPFGSLAGLNAALPADAWMFSGAVGEGERVGIGMVSTGDFDGDGAADLLAGAGYWDEGRGRVFLGVGGW